jgi:hypothetical protein
MCQHLEVAEQPPSLWRRALLDGFAVWRELVENHGGQVSADLDLREVRYLGPPEMASATAAAAAPE